MHGKLPYMHQLSLCGALFLSMGGKAIVFAAHVMASEEVFCNLLL
jgi:hypothetical protein